MLKLRAVCQPDAWLPVILIRGAGGDQTVGLEAPARNPGVLNGAAFERSVFDVISYAVVHRQIALNLPAILNVCPVDGVCGVHESRACASVELCRAQDWVSASIFSHRSETGILAKMELLEQGVVREMADVHADLHGMAPVSPGCVINVLVTILESPLRAAEIRPDVGSGQSLARQRALRWSL